MRRLTRIWSFDEAVAFLEKIALEGISFRNRSLHKSLPEYVEYIPQIATNEKNVTKWSW